ncbi:MAG: 16S rRNA (cytosine(1402)-N(4))-methyltransferase RsmH [Chloroflexota bacterium]
MSHIPVLLDEVCDYLIPDATPIERVIDGTLGAGGHTRALLEAGATEVMSFDLDPQAIAIATENLGSLRERVHIVHDSYQNMAVHAKQHGWGDGVDAILLDLGVSSMQLDTAERGFAFRYDAPLDMRFNPESHAPTAADIVNSWDADALADIFYKYGEERHGKHLANVIVGKRPFETTQQLAEVIAENMPKRHTLNIHPATRIFQALRIAVNDELRTIETTLPLAIDMLKSGGRLAVISFHSLEDRFVKHIFKDASTEFIAPPGMASIEEKEATVDLLTRKPIVPSEAEMNANPRSRSSKMRVVEKR